MSTETLAARFGSGQSVRRIEDPALVQMLADRQIPLGVCPTSNLVLGVYPSIEAHPIERLRQARTPASPTRAVLQVVRQPEDLAAGVFGVRFGADHGQALGRA